jgi:hypothetical protein
LGGSLIFRPGERLFLFAKNIRRFFVTFIFVFWDMVFNQEHHVHATAAACKKQMPVMSHVCMVGNVCCGLLDLLQ